MLSSRRSVSRHGTFPQLLSSFDPGASCTQALRKPPKITKWWIRSPEKSLAASPRCPLAVVCESVFLCKTAPSLNIHEHTHTHSGEDYGNNAGEWGLVGAKRTQLTRPCRPARVSCVSNRWRSGEDSKAEIISPSINTYTYIHTHNDTFKHTPTELHCRYK